MDSRAWRATVHGVTKSQTQLSNFTFTFQVHKSALLFHEPMKFRSVEKADRWPTPCPRAPIHPPLDVYGSGSPALRQARGDATGDQHCLRSFQGNRIHGLVQAAAGKSRRGGGNGGCLWEGNGATGGGARGLPFHYMILSTFRSFAMCAYCAFFFFNLLKRKVCLKIK